MPLRAVRRLLVTAFAGLGATGALVAQERIFAALEQRLAANPRDAAALEELGVEHLRRGGDDELDVS